MSDDGEVFVAVDQGGHASRAVAYDGRGQRLASAFAVISTHRNALGHVEHDGEDIVGSVRTALDELAVLVPAARWSRVGLAVQRSTIACWDRQSGAMLAPVISWQDRRHAAWLAGLQRESARVHSLTGLPLSPHYGASKLRWCLDYVGAVREARAAGRLCAGPLASLLLFRLLEQRPFLVDEANASRTQLWSPLERRWLPALLEMFGVPADVLPELAPTTSAFGTLRVGGKQVPLVACTGDQSAVPFAGGLLNADSVYVNAGTGAFVLRPLADSLVAPPLLSSVLRSSDARLDFVLEGTVNGAGSALAWFEEQEGLPAERLLAGLDAAPGGDDDVPLFLNGVSGLGSPFWAPQLESRWIGDGEPVARFRAVVESIAFLLRANLDEMAGHAPRPARIVLSGGLGASAYLCRALAALAGVPVHRLDDPEATARGLAFLVAGEPPSWQSPAMTVHEPHRDQALLARYMSWLAELERALNA